MKTGELNMLDKWLLNHVRCVLGALSITLRLEDKTACSSIKNPIALFRTHHPLTGESCYTHVLPVYCIEVI